MTDHRTPETPPGIALDAAVEAADLVGAWNWSAAEDRLRADPRFCRAHGLAPEDGARGLPFATLADTIHPADRPALHAATAGDGPFAVEYRPLAPASPPRWILARGRAWRDAGGRPAGALGLSLDITDRKRTEIALAESERRVREERAVLRHELPHRIKNIFAVVASLIGLTVRRHPEATAFAAELRGRVEALGHAHEFARPGTDEGEEADAATLFPFLRRLMAPYAADGGERLRTEGRDRAFDDGAATPLALLFHELGTNAAKFGAFSAFAGRVTIVARDEGDDVVLTWREEGGPPVPGPPAREGYGTHLAALAVHGQLGGRLERLWHPDGLEVRVRMPSASLRRRHLGPVRPA